MDFSWLGWIALLGIGSLAGAVLVHTRKPRMGGKARLQPGAQLRIKTHTSVYRSRLLGDLGHTWIIASPLSRDNYVPLREGETVTVEASLDGGVMVVRAEVHMRDGESHEFWLTNPVEISYFDRRSSHRVCYGLGVPITVDGTDGTLIDMSERGLKFRCWRDLAKGERIHVVLPWDDEPTAAWVVDAIANPEGTRGVCEYRAVFEDCAEPQEVRLPTDGQTK